MEVSEVGRGALTARSGSSGRVGSGQLDGSILVRASSSIAPFFGKTSRRPGGGSYREERMARPDAPGG